MSYGWCVLLAVCSAVSAWHRHGQSVKRHKSLGELSVSQILGLSVLWKVCLTDEKTLVQRR